MKPRIKVITLSVRDLEKSLAFFNMNNDLVLALYPKAILVKDGKVSVTPQALQSSPSATWSSPNRRSMR